jgi:hypothetical protein
MFGINLDPRWGRLAFAVGALLAVALAAGVDYKW